MSQANYVNLSAARAVSSRWLNMGLGCGLLLICTHTQAWEYQLSVPLSVQHDSNPALQQSGESAVWLTSISPRYQLSRDYGNRQLGVRLGVGLSRSSDQQQRADRNDWDVGANWGYQSEVNQFDLGISYKESSAQDEELTENSLLVQDDTRTSQNVSASMQHTLSELTRISASLGLGRVEYSNQAGSDYDNYSASATVNRQLNEYANGFLRANFSDNNAASVTESDASRLGLSAGGDWLLSDRLSTNAMLGVNSAISGGNRSVVGNLGLSYDYQRASSSISVGRSVDFSGVNGYSEIDRVSLGATYQLSDYSQTGVSWALSHNQQADSEYQSLSGWLDYQLTASLSTRLSYQYKQRDQAGRASANVLGMSLIYSYSGL